MEREGEGYREVESSEDHNKKDNSRRAGSNRKLILFFFWLFTVFLCTGVTGALVDRAYRKKEKQHIFFANQKCVALLLFPGAKVVCQLYSDGWHCNAFDFVDRPLSKAIDWDAYSEFPPWVIDFFGLNKKVNRVIGEKLLPESDEDTDP